MNMERKQHNPRFVLETACYHLGCLATWMGRCYRSQSTWMVWTFDELFRLYCVWMFGTLSSYNIKYMARYLREVLRLGVSRMSPSEVDGTVGTLSVYSVPVYYDLLLFIGTQVLKWLQLACKMLSVILCIADNGCTKKKKILLVKKSRSYFLNHKFYGPGNIHVDACPLI